MPRIRAVLFDLDQTLLDRDRSLAGFLKWQGAQFASNGLTAPHAFARRFIELDDHGRVWKDTVYARLIDEFELHNQSVEELLSIYLDRFQDFSIEMTGVGKAIQTLSETCRLGLVSNGKTPFQETNFQALGFAHLFKSIIVSEKVGMRKPDPAIFELACAELGVAPNEAVFVGDNPIADIEGAKNAGLGTVFIPSKQYPECPLADATCAHFDLLEEIISQHPH